SLSTTFRTTQTISDVSSRFIMRNPAQLRKTVRSAHGPGGAPIDVIAADDRAAALADCLEALAREVATGTLHPRTGDRVTVDVLGRYRFERENLRLKAPRELLVTFRTVH